jgi:putative ABC transport system substrate-binding protein
VPSLALSPSVSSPRRWLPRGKSPRESPGCVSFSCSTIAARRVRPGAPRPGPCGWKDGSTIAINYFYGAPERFPDLVAECLRLKTDIILTTTTPAALAAKKSTSTLPILVVAIGDPVGSGLVASLARPGGNVTRLTQMSYGLSSKRLELLKETMPRISRVTVISHLTDPIGAMQMKEIEQAARALSVQLQHRGIRTAGDLAAAFEAAAKDGAQALLLTIESIF